MFAFVLELSKPLDFALDLFPTWSTWLLDSCNVPSPCTHLCIGPTPFTSHLLNHPCGPDMDGQSDTQSHLQLPFQPHLLHEHSWPLSRVPGHATCSA